MTCQSAEVATVATSNKYVILSGKNPTGCLAIRLAKPKMSCSQFTSQWHDRQPVGFFPLGMAGIHRSSTLVRDLVFAVVELGMAGIHRSSTLP